MPSKPLLAVSTAPLSRVDAATNRIAEVFAPPRCGAVRVAGDLLRVAAHDPQTVWVLRARP